MRNRKRERPAPRGWRRDAGSGQALPQRPPTCTERVQLDEGEAKAQLGECTLRVDSRRGWPRPRTRSRCAHVIGQNWYSLAIVSSTLDRCRLQHGIGLSSRQLSGGECLAKQQFAHSVTCETSQLNDERIELKCHVPHAPQMRSLASGRGGG